MVKKIISGQTCDTDTATRLRYREGHAGNTYQGLYQTLEGAFFLWEYDEELGDIKPTTDEEAYEWLEKHANHLLGHFLEGRAAKRRLTIQLPASLVLRLEALAAEKSLSLKSYLMRSLKQCASAEQRASIRQDPDEQPRRQMGGRGPAQMVAPLQAKPICVEIGEVRDHVVERPCVVRLRRQRRRGLADAARMSPHRHHAARRALDFAWRCALFDGDLGSACATSE